MQNTQSTVTIKNKTFIVVTEDPFGGCIDGDDSGIFRDRTNADDYCRELGLRKNLATQIISSSYVTDNDHVFLVVTEEWFGGKVKCFTNEEEADNYCNDIKTSGKNPPQTIVVKKSVE